MKKFYSLFIFILCCFFANAQVDTTLSAKDKAVLDSMINDLFGEDSIPEKSYFDVSLSVGNSFFSTNNNSFNAVQSQTQQLFYTPAVAYYHKSGLGISLASYITNDKGKPKLYQYTISPFWEFSGKYIAGALSYSRNISGQKTSFEVSPFKNDFFGNIELVKPWVKPGLAMGYSTGKSVEYFDTVLKIQPDTTRPPIFLRIKDTITTKLKAFSLTFSLSHRFEFEKFFSSKDGLVMQPTVMLNASSYRWNITHSNSLSRRRPAVQRELKNRYGDGPGAEKFTLQSLGFNFDITYSIGKFYLQPNIYFDYYLPETTEKKITSIFNLTAGFTF